jgi:alanyl-tRNA synthetase
MVDDIKNQVGTGVILLANISDEKISLVAGVTKDLTGKVKAGDLVNFVAKQVGGKGGGRPDLAQAGGTDIAALPKAVEKVKAWLEERL